MNAQKRFVCGALGRALLGAAVLAPAALVALPAAAQNREQPRVMTGYEIGRAAYDSRQYDQAIDIWTRYAEAGDVRCQQVLGDVYSNVEFTARTDLQERPTVAQRDYVEALKWYALAANYDFETRRALEGREPAAEEVNASIVANQRLPKVRRHMSDDDVRKAEQLVSETFQRGSPYDLHRLGEMYQTGSGVAKDNVRALQMYRLASQRGVKAASEAARLLTEPGKDGARLMTKKDIERADELAADWQPPLPVEHTRPTRQQEELERVRRELEELQLEERLRAVADIDVELIQRALRALGFYFGSIDNAMGPATREAIRRFQYSRVESSFEMSETEKEAVRTGVLSARQTVELIAAAASSPANHAMSQYVYGVMHVQGIGVQPDGALAVDWLRKAAAQNLAIANYALGVVYRDGTPGLNPVRPDKALAAQYFARSHALGYGPAGEALRLLDFEAPPGAGD